MDHEQLENRKIGQKYWLSHRDGSKNKCKIAYYPLDGTYRKGKWIDFDEPRVLVEWDIKDGREFREVPGRFLIPLDS